MSKNDVNIVFMGTPEFAVSSLRALVEEGYRVVGVVTQPDRPTGRKRVLTPPPVKLEAERHGIPVLQPERIRRPEAIAGLRELQPDLIVTAAYGQILPKAVLEMPQHGCINIHASLLPKYRGGAPIHYAVMNGDPVTGVTIMYMAEGMDTGDMISKVEVPIADDDTTGILFERLAAEGAELLKRTLPDLLAGRIVPQPQNEEEAVYSPTIKREDEQIDWTQPAERVYNLVRALHPRPGAYTWWNGEVLKLWGCVHPVRPKPGQPASRPRADAAPGTVLQATDQGIEVMTGSGTLWVTELQPAGKKAMDAAQFLRGSSMAPGTVLGSG
ncbi:methionyl-tRNA formyltransferase [Paenibacillus hamazuiensis]|uniref:methionyl-tRNA formyltransferase n=1 Tax=Paenibacillus hamazuiensis TaxID=2936508 RepID=UPI00200FDD9B|nr:methionyl-tRNA formyltransferase [Paenibacillus hamazuiensis]